MRNASRFLCLSALLLAPPSGLAAENALALATARESVAQWVRTRQLISETRAAWESDKETLGQTKALFERELATVRGRLAGVSTNSTVANGERREAEAALKEHTEALEAARVLAAELEVQARQVLPLLPPPLLATVKPLTDRLPADSADTKAGAGERLQTVVALLNEIDKFNNAVTVAPEKQPNAKGEMVAVDTLYLGLSGAWFVDAAGEVAGTGRPSPQGWQWTPRPEIAAQVRDAVAVYRSQKPAAFVALPASVQ